MDNIDWIKNNIFFIKTHLYQVSVIFIMGFVIGFSIQQFRVNLLQDSNTSKDERIAAKEDLLQKYYTKELGTSGATSFTKLSNVELRNKTFETVSQIHNFLLQWEEEENKISFQEATDMRKATSTEEKNRVWDIYTNTSTLLYRQKNQEYSAKFKTDTIVLRDELLSRLPKEFRDNIDNVGYEHHTNRLTMEDIVTNLEILAKNLPLN